MVERHVIRGKSIVVASLCLLGILPLKAQDKIQGASAVFELLKGSLEKAESPDKENAAQQEGSMKEKIQLLQKKWDIYTDKRKELSAEASVAEWLDIYDLYTEASLKAKRMDWTYGLGSLEAGTG
ncbi:MAG: hypothetical protein GXP30_13530 [Verrucomicrobia bacterium]|nr:hypothetical protein [Verrucomicrobiota bacterium]